jgi:hypothetical protein
MALTFDQLKTLARNQSLNFFEDAGRATLLAVFGCVHGVYAITISLQEGGGFLQMRTNSYCWCPASHPNLTGMLRTLAAVNYLKRMVKFAWDEGDGEVVGYADVWLMPDGVLTDSQFGQMLSCFIAALDGAFNRIKRVIETGIDPGETTPSETPGPISDPNLPPGPDTL